MALSWSLPVPAAQIVSSSRMESELSGMAFRWDIINPLAMALQSP